MPSGEELTEEFGALAAMVARMLGLEANDGTSRSAQIMDAAATVLRHQPGTPPIEVLDKIDKMLAQQVAHLPPDQRADAVARYLDSLAEDAPGPLTDTADLDRVIALHERLLGELPPDHEERDLVELGHLQLRMARQQFTTDPGDAAAGIAALAPMLGEAAMRIPQLFARISKRMNLDSALIESSPALGQAMSLFEVLPLLDQRRRRHRDRLAALDPDDPDRPAACRALVLSSFEYHQLTADETAYREAVELMQQADAAGDAPDPMSVVQWGQVALLRAQHMTSAEHGRRGRGGLAAVASDQAASALRGGDVRGALEALEENRAHLLSTAVAARHDLRGLRAVAPDLADELAALRDAYVTGLEPGHRHLGGSHGAVLRVRREVGRGVRPDPGAARPGPVRDAAPAGCGRPGTRCRGGPGRRDQHQPAPLRRGRPGGRRRPRGAVARPDRRCRHRAGPRVP